MFNHPFHKIKVVETVQYRVIHKLLCNYFCKFSEEIKVFHTLQIIHHIFIIFRTDFVSSSSLLCFM